MNKNVVIVAGAVVVVGLGVYLVTAHPATKNVAPGAGTVAEMAASESTSTPLGSVALGNTTYYRVLGNDPTRDTGTKVCAAVGKACVGYTDYSVESCLKFHPSAATVADLDGAKAGFYCNGPPQSGVCAREINTCHICRECGINMYCDMNVGTLYRETFVECK